MLKIAIYTLTRDRLEYTKECFTRLKEVAGMPFDHFVIDNGSVDGTVEWLKYEYMPHCLKINEENVGISKGSNQALSLIFGDGGYDLIIKMDNDCYIETENILRIVSEMYESSSSAFQAYHILSPHVHGIINQPTRGSHHDFGKHWIGETAIVGGLFHIVPAIVYQRYRYDENLPKAKGQDDYFCKWVKANGGVVGYIEDVFVEHRDGTEGQAKKYPEYFERKWKEEL